MKPNDLLPFTPDYIPPTIANTVSGQSSNAPPARRYARKDLNVIAIDLATARAGVALEVTGTVLWAVWASSTNAELGIHFNHQSGNPVPYHRGTFLGGVPFDKLYLTNAAAAGETITLLYTTDSPEEPFRNE